MPECKVAFRHIACNSVVNGDCHAILELLSRICVCLLFENKCQLLISDVLLLIIKDIEFEDIIPLISMIASFK